VARIAVIMTGASGSAYGMRLAEQLVSLGHDIVFCATKAGREVCAYELGFDLPLGSADAAAVALSTFLELPSAEHVRIAYPEDLFDPIASGSHPLDAVIIAPASMGFCGSLAHPPPEPHRTSRGGRNHRPGKSRLLLQARERRRSRIVRRRQGPGRARCGA